MKLIPLTRNKTAIVDDEDFERVSQYKWTYSPACYWDGEYAYRMEKRSGKYVNIPLHRFILDAKPGEFVDHRNGNGLDNRRSNIRLCTPAENNRYRKPSTANTSGFKGVSWCKRRGKWKAHIGVNGRQMWLGYHTDPREAARAYDRAALEHYGEFALTNAMLGLLPIIS